ncbi:MAG: hypothetical protein ISS82_03645 [Nanoarchaeota archaeon]|nr:hypothetical protein [Nanoarchaeota archaeon]
MLKKTKAILEIFILVFSIFSISLLNVEDVSAGNVCCEKVGGEYCLFTDDGACDSGFNKASTACESTNFCELGCCYSVEDGVCSKNTPKAICESDGGAFSDDPNCEISQCQDGCCQLPGQCSFVSYAECRASVSGYAGLNFQDVFKTDILDELTCSNQCRSSEEGCCIVDGDAKFITRTECVDLSGDFNLNMLCSNPSLGTGCTKEHHTSCLTDKNEVYWFDSCGNRENVYGTSYNGFVKEAPEGDGKGNIRNVNNGNCDYVLGSLCTDADDEFLEALDDAGKDTNKIKHMCTDLTCDSSDLFKPDTIQFGSNYWRLDEDKQNGETWCVYDGKVGDGVDLVGSRHYRHVCLNGREVLEECKEGREEICVQGDVELSNGNEITGALCRPNRWQECLSLNDVDYSYSECENVGDCGYPCENYKKADKDNDYKECCKEECNRKKKCEEYPSDCYWHDGFKLCAPNVPTSSTDSCDSGTQECKEVWVKGGTFDDWTCKLNCDCHEAVWAEKANSLCRSLGDCGAHFNIIGKESLDGFSFTGPNEHVGSWWSKTETQNAEEFTKDNIGKWTDFNKDLVPLMGQDIFSLWSLAVSWSSYDEKPPKSWWSSGLGNLAIYGITAGAIAALSGFGAGVGTWASIWEGLSLTLGGPGAFGVLGTGLTTTATAGSIIPAGVTFTATTPTILVIDGITTTSVIPAGSTYTVPVGSSAKVIGAGTGTTSGGAGALGSVLSVISIIAIAALVLYFIHTLGYDTKTITYTATCYPWVAPTGGENCDKCKDEFKICDEYRCSSLGQNCELVNAGTEEQDCIAVNINDATPPIISLLPIAPRVSGDYTEHVGEGYVIGDNIPAYTPVDIGVGLNEPAQCKITKNPQEEYEDIKEYFGTTLYLEEHEMTINVANEELNENSLDIFGGGVYTYYVKCQDKNGNKNRAGYYIRFTVEDEPDTQPPVIEYMGLEDNTPISYGAGETDLLLELNEPGYCRYAKEDLVYEQMSGEVECPISSGSNPYRYPCSLTLEGIEDNKLNIFYIRCKDKTLPDANVNQESTVLNLRGTQELGISSVAPTGTLLTFNITLSLETSLGANDGDATCYYRDQSGITLTNGIEFLNTGGITHTQNLFLDNGEYTYYFLCMDEAGNQDESSTTFTIDTPNITIIDMEPSNGTVIRESNFEIMVVTEGKAEGTNVACNYNVGSLSGVLFFEEQDDQVIHTRNITGLGNGNYILNVECSDGYKTTEANTEFTVDMTTGPGLIGVYTSNNLVTIILDHEAICEYSDSAFEFGEGNSMIPEDYSIEKSAMLGLNIYFINCRDEYGLESSFIVYT